MRKKNWPTPSYFSQIIQVYLGISVALASIVTLGAILVTWPETLVGAVFWVLLAVLIGCLLNYAFSRQHRVDLIARVLRFISREHI